MLIESNFTREALVNKLEELLEAKDLMMRVNIKDNGKDPEMREYREAGDWLLVQQIELVKEALRNNELKDW